MSDIFREVEEDLKRERYEDLWKSYGVYIVGAAVALVATVAGVSWWNAAQQSAAEDAARQFVAAGQLAEDGDTQAAADAFAAIAENSTGNYDVVAGLRTAGLLADSGDTQGAVAAYDAIAAGSGDSILKGLASIKAAILLADTASPDELKVRLTPLADEGAPWRFSALELLGFAALRADNSDEAIEHYQALADATGAPPLARERARDMLRGLQVEGPVARQLPVTSPDATDAIQVDDSSQAAEENEDTQ